MGRSDLPHFTAVNPREVAPMLSFFPLEWRATGLSDPVLGRLPPLHRTLLSKPCKCCG